MTKQTLTQEEARERKNARQRDYAKRTHYKANTESFKRNGKRYVLNLSYSTNADIIEKLESEPNVMGYLKRLIREDIAKEN